jgi:gamma-glutamyltranspeptidase/glutathione hydrolase
VERFTTRPELRGTFGMVASTHWLASGAGMAMLERGGNAFDAAVAAGFVLQVVEPHLNGPGGEVPILLYSADRDEVLVVDGQGTAPAGATIERFRELGHSLVPGTGLLAACAPGAFDAWLLLLREFGTLPLAEVLEPTIGYAESGYPVVPGITRSIARMEHVFRDEWPGSAELYLPVPQPGTLFRNRELAATYRRVLAESGGKLEAAREVFYRGFVAEAIDAFSAEHGGLLDGDDLASWRASIEQPVTRAYHGWEVSKTGPWGQGPGLPAAARTARPASSCASERALTSSTPSSSAPSSLSRTAKPGTATWRCRWRSCSARPIPTSGAASSATRPRASCGRAARAGASRGSRTSPRWRRSRPETGEPTGGDTCHVDVVDRFGNAVSATPSGGWLHGSPVIPGLGFCLGTRAQMFWLEEGLPSSLAPRKRPRTTLSPTLARRDGELLAFGTPGGDHQDQWSLVFFLSSSTSA